MKEALKTAMATSISEVLETMFFMTIETSEGSDWSSLVESAAGERLLVSKIHYRGPLTGFFVLIVPEGVLSSMAETFMGMEEGEVKETHLSGTISEAINMIAGNTFSTLDDQAVFNLDIPELLEVAALPECMAVQGKEEIFFRIEAPGGNLGLQLFYSV